MKIRYTCLLIFLCFALGAQPVTVYLIGDTGEPGFPEDNNLDYLRQICDAGTEKDVLIFLGDNLYPNGLPDKDDPVREKMEQKLTESLDVMKAFKGRAIMIPGNHDWGNGSKDGWHLLTNMQHFVDAYMGQETVFLPRNACPGPVEVELSKEVLLVILDTQYFLHPWDKPGENESCDAQSTADALFQLDDILHENRHRHVIVAGHHPMYSYGQHGGRYSFRQHFFPLTDVNRKLWIPLPVLGSIYPLYRQLIGSRQDLTNPRYKMIRNAMVKSFHQVEDLVYISGHEHSLQYISRDSLHYVISGAGSKSSAITGGKGSEFYRQTKGFARLQYHTDGRVNLTMYDGLIQKPVFDKELYQKQVEIPSDNHLDFDFHDSTVMAPISTDYLGKSDAYQFWLGENYRAVWATPVSMPVFNIGREHGGLEIIKLGGGNQTKSLRLEDHDGNQYVLRSLDKFTEKLLPMELQRTLVADILQDQISGANPYGAFAVPVLADAAKIYHTHPQLEFIPNDPRFGDYQSVFAGLPVVYEERPTSKIADHYDNGEKVKGTPDLIEILHDDNDETVDQSFALRNRLFDMLIGDWDRHEDQWRWVRFDKEPGGHFWRPIPRDRDQAFFDSQGVIGWLTSRRFALPNTEGFDEKVDWAPGLNTSGRFFDRTFINELDWADWLEQITMLQSAITDQQIASAIATWPDTIQQEAGAKTSRILKARRDDMTRYAREHYLFLSREVEVVGSDKHEHFLVERLENGDTRVTVHKRKKDGELEQQLYQRTFKTSETREIRLYGLDGEDVFEVKGDAPSGITVRIIGGPDRDEISDESHVNGLGKKTVVYDLKKNTTLTESSETNSRLSRQPAVNAYNRTAFQYDKLLPLLSFQFNRDDGLFVGAGFLYTKEGWRKEPYAQRHEFKANGALSTYAVNLYYNGTFSDVIRKWDLNADIQVNRPFGVANYFGMGNESVYDYQSKGDAAGYKNPIDFYRIRYEYDHVYLNLSHQLGQQGLFRIGAEHMAYEVDNDLKDRYIDQPGAVEDEADLFDSHQFLGMHTELTADTRNHPMMPTKGIFAQLKYINYFGLNEHSPDFSRLQGEFRFLLSTRLPSRLVVANRIGFEHIFGDTEFYNGAYLGKSNLRGYRRTRFIGSTSFYHNLDIRLHLFTFRSYLLPASVGLIAFHDIGRVWYNQEHSDKWHTGQGFGVWVAPLNQVVITFNVAFSEEETLPIVTFGYQF